MAGVWPGDSGLERDLGGPGEGCSDSEGQMQEDSAHSNLGIGKMVSEIRNQGGRAGVREREKIPSMWTSVNLLFLVVKLQNRPLFTEFAIVKFHDV